MYQVPTHRLKKYRVPPRLPSSPNNGPPTNTPESSPGNQSVEKTLEKKLEKTPSKSETPRLKPRGQPRTPVNFRIPLPLKVLPKVHRRRPSLQSPHKPPPLSSHPLFLSRKGKATRDDERHSSSTDSRSWGELPIEDHAARFAKLDLKSQCRLQDRPGDYQHEKSIDRSETSSLESCNTQPSIAITKAPPNTPINPPLYTLFPTISPTPGNMSLPPHAFHKKSAGEDDRAGGRPLTPLGRISKLSRKFSYAKIRGRSGEKAASNPIKVPSGTTSITTSGTTSGTAPRRTLAGNREPAYPPWERSMDVSWEKDPDVTWCDLRQLVAFKLSLAKFIKDSDHLMTRNMVSTPYLRLPDAVRFRICKYLVGDGENKAIRMNPIGAFRPAWPEQYFESMQSVLESLERYTSVSSGFRADILVTLFTTRHFHVVWSPYVMPLTSPAAVYYMRKYSGLMQHVTLEFDFAKLGFGAEPGAHELRPGIQNMYPRVDEFIDAQKEREELSTLFSVRILVRRYHGRRKVEGVARGEEGEGTGSHCTDKHLKVLDSLKCLGGIVERARIVGCSEEYTNDLIRYFWVDMPQDEKEWIKHCGRIAPSTLYPLLPGQSSYLDYGPGRGRHIVKHPATFIGPYGVEIGEAAVDRRHPALGGIIEG